MPLPAISDLQSQREHKAGCLKELMKNADEQSRVLTVEEQSTFDRIETELGTIDSQMEQIQASHERATRLKALQKKYEEGPGRFTTPDQPATTLKDTLPATFHRRTGTLKAFTGANSEERAYRCGMWARAVILNDQNAWSYCQTRGMLSGNVRNALSTISNPDGGVLVPEEFSQTIIDLREKYGVWRASTRVVPMGRDTMLIPRRLTGVTIGPVGENPTSAITQSSPTWNQVRLTAKKAGGLCLMSSEIAEDAVIDLADWLAQEFAYAFALYEDQCGFIGDGTSTYLGIRGLGNMFTTTGGVGGGQLVGAVDAVAGHDTFAEIDVTDLAMLMAKLPAYVIDPKFYCSKVCAELVFGRLQAVAGGNNTETLSNGKVGRTYLGYPIVISQVLPVSTGDLSDVPMFYFGDLAMSSTMGDRRDIRVFPSEHRYMDTDQIGVRATERFDIVNHDVGDTTTGNAGPIVALVGE